MIDPPVLLHRIAFSIGTGVFTSGAWVPYIRNCFLHYAICVHLVLTYSHSLFSQLLAHSIIYGVIMFSFPFWISVIEIVRVGFLFNYKVLLQLFRIIESDSLCTSSIIKTSSGEEDGTLHFRLYDILLIFLYILLFALASDLNGCNGEATNTDDVAAPPNVPPALSSVQVTDEAVLDIHIHCIVRNHINLILITVNGENSWWNQDNSSYMVLVMTMMAIPAAQIRTFVAFINGSNGEATNTDDLDNALNQLRGLSLGEISHRDFSRPSDRPHNFAPGNNAYKKRMRNNMIHSSTTPHKPKKHTNTKPDVLSEPGSSSGESRKSTNTPPVGIPTSGNSLDSVELPSSPKVVYQRSIKPYQDVGFDGNNYFHLENEISCEVTTWNVGGPGWYDPDPEGKKEGFLPLVREVESSGYYRRLESGRTLSIPRCTYNIIVPVVEKLFERFPASKTSPQWTAALAASVTKQTKGFLISEGNDSLSYVLGVVHKRDTTYVGEASLQKIYTDNGHAIGLDNNGIMGNMAVLQLFNSFAPLRVDDVELDVVEDYEVRDDFRIVSGNVNITDTGLPIFTEGPDTKITHRDASSTFTSRFIRYRAKSAKNFLGGLTRLTKKRANEETYRLNAAIIGNEMVSLGMISDELALSINHFHDGIADIRDEHLANQNINPDVPSLIAKALKRVVDLNDRTTIQIWLDTIQTKYAHTLAKTEWLYYNMWKNFSSVFYPDSNRSYIGQMPHLKRRLRERFVKGALLADLSNLLVKEPKATIKMEPAKPSKNPRLFVTYDSRDSSATVYANELPEFTKVCIDGVHEFQYNGVTMEVCIVAKPKSHNMSELFAWLIDAMTIDNHIRTIVYSDDSCYAGNVNSKPFCFNVDISSNDSSQSSPAFISVFSAQSKYCVDAATGLLAQCMLPIKLVNPTDPSQFCSIKFDCAFEGSGHVNTTMLNNYATLSNVIAFLHVLGEDVHSSIILGAQLAGHLVTVEDCFVDGEFVLEKVQFLKRSPFYVNGKIHACLNMGVLLRSFGYSYSSLTSEQVGCDPVTFANMTFDDRWEIFNRQIISSYVNEPGNPVLDAFRRRYGHCKSEGLARPSYFEFSEETNSGCVSANSFMARYDLDSNEVYDIINAIENLKLGQHYNLSAANKIFKMDYGMSMP